MELKGKKYVEPEQVKPILFPESDVKARIKALVPEEGKKSYKEIIDIVLNEYLVQGKHFNADDILRCIKEVDAEWHPAPKITPEILE